eukprot:6106646-Pyramimonas_sp.AAC.1
MTREGSDAAGWVPSEVLATLRAQVASGEIATYEDFLAALARLNVPDGVDPQVVWARLTGNTAAGQP